MTNKKRQESLDGQKYIESRIQHKDMSGQMPYCAYCQHQYSEYGNRFCNIEHDQRVAQSSCAAAYNKMYRGR